MRELIGHECRCEFTLDPLNWPFPGSPAWVVVEDVALPLVKLRSVHGSKACWVNARFIFTIEAMQPVPRPQSRWHKLLRLLRWPNVRGNLPATRGRKGNDE